ncbi:MAG: restriction endonuclease subunit S [Nostoc sp.]|uniref:restriction endonuclease subunit S n=1 Tax=Nostoc sp. TaxID=1180 RepID=UPI002FFA8784
MNRSLFPIQNLRQLVSEDFLNGIFKKKDDYGEGTLLVNVWDLYRDEVVIEENLERIKTTAEENERFQVAEGDVFFCRSSLKPEGVGWSCLIGELSEPAVFECHLIRARVDYRKVLPAFLNYFVRSRFGTSYVRAKSVVTTMATIDQGTLYNLPVICPPIQTQIKIVSVMDKARSQRRQKLAEADNLLASLDDYLLNAIGLDRPAEDNRKVFAMRVQDIRLQGRLNSDYFHPERILALRAMTTAAKKINCQQLQNIATFERNQIKTPEANYLGLAHVQTHTGELTNASDTATGNCFTFQRGDVLFARLRPYLNKVYCAEIDGCCSPEFHVLRIRDTSSLLPDYLAVILRSKLILAQTIHMMTGNTHPRLANEDVISLVIPIPGWEVQKQIAAEVQHRSEEARRLRTEAERGWQDAKKWFEEQLLGSALL